MVKVDFTIYQNFSTCPLWWRNFVTHTLKDLEFASLGEKNFALDRGIEKYHGSMIDCADGDPENLDGLIFETEDDLNAFMFYWALYGK